MNVTTELVMAHRGPSVFTPMALETATARMDLGVSVVIDGTWSRDGRFLQPMAVNFEHVALARGIGV